MNRGYLALYRKIQDHPFYKEKRVFSKYEAWIDILMEAQHSLETKKIFIGMKSIECGHGQSIKSLRTWGERWGWSAKKVQRYLNLLQDMDQIRHENVTVTTRITVLNYKKYDPKCHTNVTDMSQKGNTSETDSTHECPTDKNEKNEKNEKIPPEKKFSGDIINFCNDAFKYLKSQHSKSFPTKVKIESWYDVIDKLQRIDGFTFDEVKTTLQWGVKDSFWSQQIISFAGLREKKGGELTKFQKIHNASKDGVKTQGPSEALRQFDLIKKAIRGTGNTGVPRFKDEITSKFVSDMNWLSICKMSEYELGRLKIDFIKQYNEVN